MNSTVTFPAATPTLKLARSSERWAATLTEERRRLQQDHDALRERESNLRDYESRLRVWQAEIDAGRGAPAVDQAGVCLVSTPLPFKRLASRTPFVEDPALPAAWDKLHRARELLEAEQNHLRTDREQVREQLETFKRRTSELAAREARLAEREALVTAAMPGHGQAATDAQPVSPLTRFTRAPFDIARSVFGGK